MLTAKVKARLADDVQLWVSDGLVPATLAPALRERYQASGFGLISIVKYLGICGGVFALFGLLGLVGVLVGSEGFGGAMVLAVGGGLLGVGIWLSRDVRRRYPFSSRGVITIGAMASVAGVSLLVHALDVPEEQLRLAIGLLCVPAFAVLAYRFKDGFLLVLATLGFFHWVGSWSRMFGRSTYAIEIDEPRAMAVAALAVFALGVWHERHQLRFLRFFVVYESLALAYFNLSLLILSIDEKKPVLWMAVFSAAVLAQIVLGARLKSGLVLGFGVTFAAIDLFTRYFEKFYERLDLGLFLVLGGGALLAVGVVLERLLRRRAMGAE